MPSLSADHHAVLTATRIELLDALFEMVFEAGWAEFVKTGNARGWECAIATDESVKAERHRRHARRRGGSGPQGHVFRNAAPQDADRTGVGLDTFKASHCRELTWLFRAAKPRKFLKCAAIGTQCVGTE